MRQCGTVALLYRQYVYIEEESAKPQRQNLSCRQAWMCTLTTPTTDEYLVCDFSCCCRCPGGTSRLGTPLPAVTTDDRRYSSRDWDFAALDHISLDDADFGEASLTTGRSSSMDVSYHKDNMDDDANQKFPATLPTIA